MVGESLTGRRLELRVADVPLQNGERLVHEFRNLRERWDNRLVLERTSLAELYINGRVEVVVHGDWPGASQDYHWACRIRACATVSQDAAPGGDVDVTDIGKGDGWQDQVVLVVVVEGIEGPERFVRSVFRPHLFEKKVFGVGEGLLYRREIGMGYEVFPFGGHWEEGSFAIGRKPSADDHIGKMVQCGAEIVNGITDDEAERLWDWLFGPIGKLKLGRIKVDDRAGNFSDPQLVKLGVNRCGSPYQFIDVAVGPLNL